MNEKKLTQEQMDELIEQLDKAAMKIDFYEYGLPGFDRDELYEIIQKWYAEAQGR